MEPVIRNISDTARWVAIYRARETERPDALFRRWVLDLASPGLLRMLQRKLGALNESGSPLKFGPAEGPDFFTPHGWKPSDVRSMLKTAARLGRLPLWMRLMAMLPESPGPQGSRPWSGICLLARSPEFSTLSTRDSAPGPAPKRAPDWSCRRSGG